MTTRSEDRGTSAAPSAKPDLNDLTEPQGEAEMRAAERDEVPEMGWEAGQPSAPEDIRLRAYYRYMERQGGDDDEIADWLAAESELRQPRRGTGPQRAGSSP
jgi:hypothetical protein